MLINITIEQSRLAEHVLLSNELGLCDLPPELITLLKALARKGELEA